MPPAHILSPAAPPKLSLPIHARRMAMVSLMGVSALAALDTTISNTALPTISAQLGAAASASIWVANAYQIAMIAGLLPCSSLGESTGYRRVFLWGLVLFTAASLLCGISSTLAALVVGRALQGLGAAAIMSVCAAFIRHIYPPSMLGRGLSINALVVAIGFTLGPPLASAVLAVGSWHWLFLLNVPIGLAALPLAARFLPMATGGGHPFAPRAALLCAGFLGLFAFAFCSFENGAGRDAAGVAALLCAICFVALLKIQRRHPAPMLPLDLLGIPVIGLSSLTSICAFATQSLAFVALPFYMQHVLGISVVSTGLLLTAWPAVVAAMAVLMAPLSDRASPAVLCTTGLLILALGMLGLAMTSPSAASHALIVAKLTVCGIGFGIFQSPNMKAIMSNAPAHRSGGASGVVAISRLTGQTAGAALVAQSFHLWQGAGPSLALWFGVATASAGVVFSALRLKARAVAA